MTVKVWKADLSERAYTHASLLNVENFMNIDTMEGVPLADRFPVAKISVYSEYPPSDYFKVGPGLFIVSDVLLAVLTKFPIRVETLPVDVAFQGVPYEHKRFFFLNILDEVDCLDRSASIYAETRGHAEKIKKLVLNERSTEGKCLFRLARYWGLMVLVCEPLAAAVENANITGVRFIAPSEWRWG